MSKIKQLRNSDENNISLIGMLEQLIVSDKTKYVELLRKLIVNRIDSEETRKGVYEDLYNRLPNASLSDDMDMFELMFISSLISWTDQENIISFNQFVNYNERKLVEKNDLTTYKSFDEISCEISKVDLKMITKEMESQVVSLYSDDEWLVIKPLTYESSKKYGSNTKWCTTSAHNPEYFFRYTKNGILIYCVNRKTGYKVAAYKDMKERDVSFWNQRDERIDSFYTELTDEIISILRKEFKTCSKSNGSLVDPSAREKEMMRYLKEEKKMPIGDLEAPRRIRVGNRYDEVEQQEPNDEAPEEDMGDMEVDEEVMEERVVERVLGRPQQYEEMGEMTESDPESRPYLTSNQILELLSDGPVEGYGVQEGIVGREVPNVYARAITNTANVTAGMTGGMAIGEDYATEMPQRG